MKDPSYSVPYKPGSALGCSMTYSCKYVLVQKLRCDDLCFKPVTIYLFPFSIVDLFCRAPLFSGISRFIEAASWGREYGRKQVIEACQAAQVKRCVFSLAQCTARCVFSLSNEL